MNPGQAAVSDVIIGTSFNQSDYIIESSKGEIASGTVTSSNPAVIRLNSTFEVAESGFLDRMKGIRVRAIDQNPISVFVVIQYNDFGLFRHIIGYSSYLVHPNSEFSTERDYIYYAISFENATIPTELRSNILLVGNHNETLVFITPTQDVSLPRDAQSNSSLMEVEAGTTHNVTLNSFQTLGFFAHLDLTGTKIVSDKPLTVISGHQCAQIPSTTGYCEPLYIHLPPTYNWGTNFLLAPFGGRTANQYYKVVASEDFTTTVEYRCGNNTRVLLQFTTAGNSYILSFPSNSYCYLSATSPVFMLQLSPGNEADGIGDPALAIVSPTTAHVRSASFFSLPRDFPNGFITVTVQAEHFNSSQILFDGNPLSCDWNSILNTFSDDIIGYGCTHNVSSEWHIVTHSGEIGLLSVAAYGWSASDGQSFGYAYLTNYNPKKQGTLILEYRMMLHVHDN